MVRIYNFNLCEPKTNLFIYTGMYTTGSFYLMKCFFELAPMIVLIFIYVAIGDIFSRQPETTNNIYLSLVLVLVLSTAAMQGVGQIASILLPGSTVSLLVVSMAIFYLHALLGNFFVRLHTLHYVYKDILSQLSIGRFALESSITLQYGFGRCSGVPGSVSAVLYSMAIDGDHHYYHCLLMLAANCLITRIIAFALLTYSVRPVKR